MLLDVLSFANTFGVMVLILHPIFGYWARVSPSSMRYVIHLFVFGLKVDIDKFDQSWKNIILGTLLKAAAFWLIGFVGATIYNYLVG